MNIEHAYYRRLSYLSVMTLLFLIAGSIELSAGETWERQQLDAAFRSEGSAAADVNKDGKMDVIAGDVWYEAPDWKMHEVRKPGKFVAGVGYSDSFCNFAYDINQDGWTDFIYVSFPGKEFYWYENPKNKPGHWKEHLIWHSICNETPKFSDLNGDGKPELIFGSQPEKQMGYLEIPSPELATKKWDFIPISKPGDPKKNGTFKYYHGLGVGDFNKDGRQDVLIPDGWWEGPEVLGEGLWKFHPFTLSVSGAAPAEKMADLYVEDLDQDGDNDIIGSSAHAFGVWWFENVSEAGKPKFKGHLIDKSYSQTHAMHFLDMNGDGQRDMVTGKRFFAHNGKDPGGKDPVVMYWYEIKRGKNAAPQFIPHKIKAGNDTGVGTQFSMADMNGDGRPDIVLSNKKGVNVLLQK
ncbi:MAG: VCBS repeat-containing protein [Planctomycetes bacterium]|nr:VCBS repeat-containing protein [Planctomycetota bacterium]MCH9726379.1 VCBS repeat-containing protein [Planctomycetota bacterium]MCH9775881.1 VCBS repeat-containing protein [Planctomycetota bacterium]MCH9791288.1 VCBS repeat-containing protein [Planctomycetota bacterium]